MYMYIYIYVYVYVYIYIYICILNVSCYIIAYNIQYDILAPSHHSPNLPTKIMPTKIAWLKYSGKFPMDIRIPPLKIKILLESNPLKSRILVRRLAVPVSNVLHTVVRFVQILDNPCSPFRMSSFIPHVAGVFSSVSIYPPNTPKEIPRDLYEHSKPGKPALEPWSHLKLSRYPRNLSRRSQTHCPWSLHRKTPEETSCTPMDIIPVVSSSHSCKTSTVLYKPLLSLLLFHVFLRLFPLITIVMYYSTG